MAADDTTFLRNMALDRSGFKDKVREHLGGALIEFYKARLARKNGFTRWTQHWDNEVARLVGIAFPLVLLDRIRGFKDRRKAVRQVVDTLQSKDRQFRGYADYVVRKDFNVRRLRHRLSDEDSRDFWLLVEDTMEAALAVEELDGGGRVGRRKRRR